MSTLETLPTELGLSSTWQTQGGVLWLDPGTLSVRQIAQSMNALRARFITITAYQLPKDTGLRLEYHWDLGGKLLGFGWNLTGNQFESIYDLSEAVDWIEREIHEGFAIDFTGREYEPLLLRVGDTPGVNLREAESLRSPFATTASEEVKP